MRAFTGRSRSNQPPPRRGSQSAEADHSCMDAAYSCSGGSVHGTDNSGGGSGSSSSARSGGSTLPMRSSLWPLQIERKGGASDARRRRPSASSLVSPASSPPASSSQQRALSGPAIDSPSPPSPFGHSQCEKSPPTTPPDSVLSGSTNGARHKRDFSWDFSSASISQASHAGLHRGDDPENRPVRAADQLLYPVFDGPAPPPASLSPSRNDIFSALPPTLAPAPRLDTRIERKPSSSRRDHQPDISSPPSRQSSFFFASSAAESLASAVVPNTLLSNGQQHNAGERPAYGRSSTEERERERQRIRQNNTEIDFRLCPSKDFLLGEGRHSRVYLGSYRIKGSSRSIHSEGGEAPSATGNGGGWNLCAIKRPFADHQSQLLALEEAFALRRLGPHPSVVRLIKIRDEVELQATSPQPRTKHPTWSGRADVRFLNSAQLDNVDRAHRSLGKGLPSGLPTAYAAQHSRSSSDTDALNSNLLSSSKKSIEESATAHRRLASTPTDSALANTDQPVILIAAPEGEDGELATQDESVVGTQHAGDTSHIQGHGSSTSTQSANETPSLLILLELLPYSMTSFTRRNADQVNLEQWFSWALELASVVEWMHSKGCIHADLKPENILLTSDLHVKICDFNSALFPHPSTPLTDGLGLGTPAYGAPELTRGSITGFGANGFGFGVDIWSLGAVLYTIATGAEPFRRARSMIDIMYRKRVFFESEENDRAARLSVAEGSSTAGPGSAYGGGSATVSRHGSLRGRDSIAAANLATSPAASPRQTQLARLHHRRAPSTESVESVTSSVALSHNNGRMPSVDSINLLLDDLPPIGILKPLSPLSPVKGDFSLHRASSDRRPSASTFHPAAAKYTPATEAEWANGHNRTASLGKDEGQHLSPQNAERRMRAGTLESSSSTSSVRVVDMSSAWSPGSNGASPMTKAGSVGLLLKPGPLRRATSYGGPGMNGIDDGGGSGATSDLTDINLNRHNGPEAPPFDGGHGADVKGRGLDGKSSMSNVYEDTGLRLAVTAAFAQLKRDQADGGRGAEQDVHTDLPRHRQARSGDYSTASGLGDGNVDAHGHWHEGDGNFSSWTDVQPYPDGYPALILPGGGRLPNAARDLLKRMLCVDPALRPTATQVRQALEAL